MSKIDEGSSTSRIAAGGQTLDVRRIGRGPVLLWIHGGPGLDHHSLLPLARRLAGSFESWLPDLPGHGGGGPGHKFPGLYEIRDRLERWLSGLDPAPDVLIGHSLGAWFAREAVRRDRLRPRAMVLLSPPAGGRRAGATPIRAVEERFGPRFPAGGAHDLREGAREFRAFLEADPPGEVSDELSADLGRASIRPAWRYSKLLRQWHRALRSPTPPCPASCPSLIVCGRLDAVTPPAQAEAIHDRTKGSELVLLEGVGHVPWAADAGPIARRLEPFLERALSAPGKRDQTSSSRRRRTK